MARMVSQDDMNQIFEIVDELGISREAIKVPLAPKGNGNVERLASGQFRITIPADRTLDTWLPELKAALRT